ncbi:phage holin, LLH family [Secundilactobacillus yichangensis]|uniref:phage holin, LLH family n=1 Tax=Secundilactobacillus yichangensis TaxID=2799580 RepID=UPI001942C95A|nr:phage holin, LLH family [Secundilactobacillus yichangensis]
MQNALQVLSDSGALQTILMAILTAVVIPLINQGHKSAKTKKVSNIYDVLDKLAEGTVAKLATQYDLPSGVKHDQALQTISEQLATKGIKSVDAKEIDMAIEKAYQYFTSLDTKAQTKQSEFNDGLSAADKESQKAVETVSEPNVEFKEAVAEPVKVEASADPEQDSLTKLRNAIASAQKILDEKEQAQGGDKDA